MAIFTSLLGDFIANFAGDFMSDYLSNKLHSNKEQIVVQKSELLSVVESEIDKKISIMQMQQSEQYLEAELNHLRSQQNMVLEALLEYIQTNNGVSVANYNDTYCFKALPEVKTEEAVIDYPIDTVDYSLARIPLILAFEGCSTNDTSCLNYNEILSYFMNYLKKCGLKYSADLIVCSCNAAGPFVFQTLMPVSDCAVKRLSSKISDNYGAVLLFAHKLFENAKSFYASMVMRIKQPVFMYITKCSNFSSSNIAQETSSIADKCRRNGSYFSIVNVEKSVSSNKFSSMIINADCSDEQSTAYAMVKYLCCIANERIPDFNSVNPEPKKVSGGFEQISLSERRRGQK